MNKYFCNCGRGFYSSILCSKINMEKLHTHIPLSFVDLGIYEIFRILSFIWTEFNQKASLDWIYDFLWSSVTVEIKEQLNMWFLFLFT